MKKFSIILFAAFAFVGCGGGAPPAELSLEEIPTAFQKGFQTAKEETRVLMQGIVKQIEKRQLSPAAFQLQNLLEDRSLTKEQSSLIARALMTVNAALTKQIEIQEAAIAAPPSAAARPRSEPTPELPPAASEDAAAAKAMRDIYRRTK